MSSATITLFGSPAWLTFFRNAQIVHGNLDSATSYTVTDGAGDSLQFIGKNFTATNELLSGGTITGFKMTLGNGGTKIASGQGYDFPASAVANAVKLFEAGHKTALLNLFVDVATAIHGSSGDDTIIAPPGGGSVVGGGGVDTLNLGLFPYGAGALIQTSGSGLKVTINGKVTSVSGVARVFGTALADTIHAAGTVHLIGGAGADTFIGDPTHTLTVDYHYEEFTHANYSASHAWGTLPGQHGVTVNLSGVAQGTQAADTATDTYGDTDTFKSVGAFQIWGTDAADKFYAGSTAGSFYGNGGNDTLVGGSGKDYLSGGDGNDHLTAGSGNCILDGGAGDDTLTGGSGRDFFVFDAGFGKDKVTNFDAGSGLNHGNIWISKTLFSSVADIMKHTTAIDASHCVITYDANDTITLDVAKSALVAGDFKLV